MHVPQRDPPPKVRTRRSGDLSLDPVLAELRCDEAHAGAIDRSHARCVSLGVSQFDAPDFSSLARSELALVRDRNRRLHEHAAPVMAMLHEQIVNSESMVVLTDATGTILHSIGDDDFLERAAKVALQPGANWSEPAKGTNAVGTALVEEAPTLVHADEHFLHANHFLTCSAAPILDPRGSILGVLDVSGDFRSYHRHTLALVRMSVRMIENRWLCEDYRHLLRLHFHARAEFIGTLNEGILAVGGDGRIVGANRSALEQLGMSGATLRMHTLATLFGLSLATLVDRSRSAAAAPVALALPDGRRLMASPRFDWPGWWTAGAMPPQASPASAEAPAVPAMPAPPPQSLHAESPPTAVAGPSALARLLTGDARIEALVAKLRRVVDTRLPVLIEGETGTGKEVLARALHADSARSALPFVVVHCAAPDDDFGLARLPVPEAVQDAGPRGATIFLDEVGDTPPAAQARLLRLLEERTSPGAGDVTIVCATQRDLRHLVERELFREDLFHRLSGVAVRLPPLRERSDRLPLARRIVERESIGPAPRLDAEVARLIDDFDWPGNVRQLCHVLRAACAMAKGSATIGREHLPDDFAPRAAALQPIDPVGEPPAGPLATRTLDDIEVDVIRRTVEALDGNISRASRQLGVSRNTIYRKLRWNAPRG